MARKPNYDFERRERERVKAAKAADRAKAKAAAKGETEPPEDGQTAPFPQDPQPKG